MAVYCLGTEINKIFISKESICVIFVAQFICCFQYVYTITEPVNILFPIMVIGVTVVIFLIRW